MFYIVEPLDASSVMPSSRSPRPPHPHAARGLSREQVVTAALELVDRDGATGLTMRGLGRELGVDPMAIYHWVPNKPALLDAIVEAVWSELELPARRGPWPSQLRRLAVEVRAVLIRHPHALPILATRQGVSAPALDALEQGIAILRGAGLAPEEALPLVAAAFHLIVGNALALAGVAPDAGDGGPPQPDDALLGAVTERTPNLGAALEADIPDLKQSFHAGLDALLQGAQRMLASRS
jgi:TetR/AcrR family transcriptional regulator, tetracycline repressor protein